MAGSAPPRVRLRGGVHPQRDLCGQHSYLGPDRVPCRAANHSQVVIRLQVEPGLGGCREKPAEPESGVGGDRPITVHDPADPVGGHTDVARQTVDTVPAGRPPMPRGDFWAALGDRAGCAPGEGSTASGAPPARSPQADRWSARSKSFRPGGPTKRRRQGHPAADSDHLPGHLVGEIGREELHDLGVVNARWRWPGFPVAACCRVYRRPRPGHNPSGGPARTAGSCRNNGRV